MSARVHQKLGTAGFIIAIVALVAALGGGAYAASGALSGKQKKEVEKIAKKYAGKPGPAGATGPAGTAGATGPAGTAGATGPAGTAGAAGNDGAAGKEGKAGEEGSPWTVGGVLPSGETETGIWGTGEGEAAGSHFFPMSFTLPLLEPLAGAKTVVVKSSEGTAPGCPGLSQSGVPTAEPGMLCVYVGPEEGVAEPPSVISYVFNGAEWEVIQGADASGALVKARCLGTCFVGGTWALTAE
jgi:hypothetical protein